MIHGCKNRLGCKKWHTLAANTCYKKIQGCKPLLIFNWVLKIQAIGKLQKYVLLLNNTVFTFNKIKLSLHILLLILTAL